MTVTFTGGCLCSAVRYQCKAEPMMTGHCHCRNCQKASGAGFITAFAVPEAALEITGAVKFYETPTDSGGTSQRGFCPECGSRLFARSSNMAGMMAVMAGCMDDSSWLEPGMNIFTEHAQPWSRMDPALPNFPGMPEMPEG